MTVSLGTADVEEWDLLSFIESQSYMCYSILCHLKSLKNQK